MQLSFSDPNLHRLCCRRRTLEAKGRRHAADLARLLNEIACAETLALLASLPHLEVVGRKLVAVRCEPVRVLLAIEHEQGKPAANGRTAAKGLANPVVRLEAAKAARVVALQIDGEDFNPEGAKWP